MKLHGIIPPLVTPMHADESLDLEGLRRHIDWLLGHRVHGLFVLGTTGEFYALDDAEKQAVVAATVAHATGRDTLMYAALQHGAAGAIPATCNVAPEFCVGIYEAFQRGDYTAAKAFQDRLHPVRTALSLGTSNGGVKEGLALRGRDAGPNRR